MFLQLVVDIHSHILPEVDDGPKSWDVCVSMCRTAAADGITHMVATPHANDRYHYDREYMQGLVAHLQQLVGDAPKITLGCDFHLSYENIQDALVHPSRYVIGNTRYLLVEFSNYGIPQNTTDSFLKLGDHGITVIITHPERNPILRESLQRVAEWAEQGCVVQMTGSALTGFWGDRTRRAAVWLLEHQAVHVLATDAHDMEKRVPILSSARDAAAEICGEEVAEALVEGNPRAILENQPLPYFPRPSAAASYRKR
ncbi:MAG TPA: CpsB/CapC family capsule biosynthesis tyrosine phosphatase [Candidatus Dormibacteraeota bacterium]|nr:CpsB/CapC family capsule biosynthesis tyrosine phosphatase [Candidatus Dormibacteraeota bacterium]